MKEKKSFSFFSSFYERELPDSKVRSHKGLPDFGKSIQFFSRYETGCDVEGYPFFDDHVCKFPNLDTIDFKSEKLTELQIFIPKSAETLIDFKSDLEEIKPFEKIIFDKNLTLKVSQKKSEGTHLGFVPILYLLKNEKETITFTIPVPVFVERKGKGWDLPLYHYLHPKAKEYLYPFLWKKYPKERSKIFNLFFPYPKKYVKHKDTYFTDGIFYWIFNVREGERKTYLYNFTADPVTFKLFTPSGIKEVEVLGNSREYYELPEDLQFVIAIGENRMEWFPI